MNVYVCQAHQLYEEQNKTFRSLIFPFEHVSVRNQLRL